MLASLTAKRQEALRDLLLFLAKHGRYPTGPELAEFTGLNYDKAWYRLRVLSEEGLLTRRKRLFVLTEKGLAVAQALGSTLWKEDEEVQTALRLLGHGRAADEER